MLVSSLFNPQDALRFLPEIILTVMGTLLMVLDPLINKRSSDAFGHISLFALLAALGASVYAFTIGGPAFGGMLMVDGFATFFRVLVIAVGILTVFPSYRFLREVSSRLPVTRARIIEQHEKLTEYEKRAILDALETPTREGLLFLAVAGGMYAEGVDYPGERLSGVFIVSPSLPQVSFERELLKRYFDDQDESGFEFAYIQPGMTRVIQAAGRLIRSETDRGVVALLCRRFVEDPYRRYIPRDWYDEDPGELVSKDPEESVREFFAR